MLDKVKTVVRVIRIKKGCDEYIRAHFPNQTMFMRRAVELMAKISTKRVYEPMGLVGFNMANVHGCVRYYWGYYLGRQFVIVINVFGADFLKFSEEYRSLINEDLNIQDWEEVDYYCQYKTDNYYCEETKTQRIIFNDKHYICWDFKNKCIKDGQELINEKDLVEMRQLMDKDKNNFILSRKAYVYENLYGATIEWDKDAIFLERCKHTNYKDAR